MNGFFEDIFGDDSEQRPVVPTRVEVKPEPRDFFDEFEEGLAFRRAEVAAGSDRLAKSHTELFGEIFGEEPADEIRFSKIAPSGPRVEKSANGWIVEYDLLGHISRAWDSRATSADAFNFPRV